MDPLKSVFWQYGIAGSAIIAQAYVIVRQYQDTQRLLKKIGDLQEARRLDAKEITDRVTEPMQSISLTMRMILDKLLVAKGEK